MLELNKIYNGNCVDVMKNIDDNIIDLTVTSPPYDNLRDYKGYTFDFENIAKELFRITKIGGVVVWIVGDQTINGSETGTSFKQALYFKKIGFNLQDTMIINKDNYSPCGSQYCYTQSFDYMFIFSKEYIKTFNPIKKKNINYQGKVKKGRTNRRQQNGEQTKMKLFKEKQYIKKNNIWAFPAGKGYTTKDEIAYQHPAIFPDKLAYDHIISWSNEGDLVLDPMCGSGTACLMSLKAKRNYIGIDISKEYCKLAQQRIDNYVKQIQLF